MKKLFIILLFLLSSCCLVPYSQEQYSIKTQVSSEFKIRIDLYIQKQDTIDFPVLRQAFIKALSDWTKVLPVDCYLYFGNSEDPPKPNMIKINFTNKDRGEILGDWDWDNRELDIYSKSIGDDLNLAYGTCLHELGHVFGLPHIVSENDEHGSAGDIVVDNATDFIMYPVINPKKVNTKISNIEEKFANNYVNNILSGFLNRKISCQKDENF